MVSNNRRIVVARIVGGLGNQMFQYACGKAVALRSGAKLYLDASVFSRYKLHQYGLTGFDIQDPSAPWRLQTGGLAYSMLRTFGIEVRDLISIQGLVTLTEGPDLAFQDELLKSHRAVYLDGYWQSERYFDEYQTTIREDFFSSELRNRFRSGLRDELPTVSLHIRRGDYLSNATANSVHGVLGLDYYFEAIELMENRIGDEFRVKVFSDDIEWARTHLKLKQQTDFVSGSVATPHNDLRMMASCDHHIVANSSFSWWGAWLNPVPEKQVIAPQRWFATSEYVYDQICPPAWTRI